MSIHQRSVRDSPMTTDTVLMWFLNKAIKRVSDGESAMWIIHGCLWTMHWTGRPSITAFSMQARKHWKEVHTHIQISNHSDPISVINKAEEEKKIRFSYFHNSYKWKKKLSFIFNSSLFLLMLFTIHVVSKQLYKKMVVSML